MKILWVNPSFLDYRVPFYSALNKLCSNEFYLIYSQNRVPIRCIKKIQTELGQNAVGLPGEACLKIGNKGDFANSSINIPYPKGLYRCLKQFTPDIIIGEGYFQWTPWAMIRAKQLAVPFVLAYERTEYTERNCPKWRTLYRKFMNKFIDGYTVNGILTKNYLELLGAKIDHIALGVMAADSNELSKAVKNIDPNSKKKFKENLKLRNGITYLYVGQLVERKGVKYLLEAWIKHVINFPNDNLIIAGTGPLEEIFRADYSDYDSIIFTGYIDYDLIYKYYAIADIFVMPTLEDNWSLVVPEAMSCGLPVACSIYNGCYPELIKDNGKVFNPLDQNDFTKVLSDFHDMNLIEAGKRSIEIEKSFSPENAAHRVYELCTSLINA